MAIHAQAWKCMGARRRGNAWVPICAHRPWGSAPNNTQGGHIRTSKVMNIEVLKCLDKSSWPRINWYLIRYELWINPPANACQEHQGCKFRVASASQQSSVTEPSAVYDFLSLFPEQRKAFKKKQNSTTQIPKKRLL